MSNRTTRPMKQRKQSSRAGVARGGPKLARALNLPAASKLSLRKIGAQAAAPKALGAKSANTIIYVHGIGNKPVASVLKCQWDTALFGTELGDRSRMAYWVNRDFYPEPVRASCAAGDKVTLEDEEASTRAILAITGSSGDDERALQSEIAALSRGNKTHEAYLRRVAAKLVATGDVDAAGVRAADFRAKILPLPGFLRRLITRSLTRLFLRDVNDFLFNAQRRDAMEKALLERLDAGGGPFVVVAHSQGSMIAYDVLRRLKSTDIEVPLLLTIGSPLGITEVQDVIRTWTGGRLPFPACVQRWVNIADRLDPVAADSRIENDFEGNIEDIPELGINLDSPRNPHSGTGYLRTEKAREAVRLAVGNTFQQAIAPFTIAKDLVSDLEDGLAEARHEVLIQLADPKQMGPGSSEPIRELASKIEDRIVGLLKATGKSPQDAAVEHLRHFVTAQLTRLEVETLRSHYADLKINGIWRNAAKRALIHHSTHTVQASPANRGYGADGNRIAWAVLDTGIRADHPHFEKHRNVVEQWDCRKRGSAIQLRPGTREFMELDKHGHGTHVAGIVAGELKLKDGEGEEITLAGMAPRCSLYGFKVLADDGDGKDSWIIKALDKVAEINEAAGRLQIHGVNLSLGGGFDPSVFGCGHTPLCEELRRLWRQGVIVCLAAGNEGYAVLSSSDGEIQANLDLSIGDPANLDEAIAVGSVHKTNPHTYGISYFSSRGPTADGRRKPDVVAPGEAIVSARHDWQEVLGRSRRTIDKLYVEMSGTSMAAPHVSGLLAAFLSIRREFIGYPDRLKEMLLNGCVDLKRDPYMQGRGLPNLIKMLALN